MHHTGTLESYERRFTTKNFAAAPAETHSFLFIYLEAPAVWRERERATVTAEQPRTSVFYNFLLLVRAI